MEDILLKQNEKPEVERSNPFHLEVLNTKLERRKEMSEERLSKKRLGSSKQYQYQSFSKIEEEKDEPLKPGVKEYLPLHLHHRNLYYSFKKKKPRRCWNCRSWKHLKRECPKIYCFFSGHQGHIKR